MKSKPEAKSVKRQVQIYLKGASGIMPTIPTNLADLKRLAEAKMSPKGFGYMAGGAGEENTIQRNREAFENWKIIPRMLRDVGVRDTSIELFGRKLNAPFFLAPIGVLDLAYKNGDLLTAKAAANTGTPMVFSNQASFSMEKMAGLMGDSPRWFQLYWSKSDALVESLVKRAENSGCEAIVLTLDTTLLGWRLRDLDFGYLPFLEGKGIGQYTSDPVFQELMQQEIPEDPNAPERKITLAAIGTLMKLAKNYPGSFFANLFSDKPLKAVRTFINIYSRPNLSFEDLKFIRSLTKLPIVLKGILHPDDAIKALDYGINGFIVSNHGGRQVNGAVSSMEMLPAIVDAVGDKVPVMMDSGIRTGSDAFKAIALGAKAVFLGRTYAYGLAIAGQKGVEEVIQNMEADFELTMGLAGCKSISEITRDALLKVK
ncbi:MAG: lactate 2-monooxygenase [Saprospiraceae bacterium]